MGLAYTLANGEGWTGYNPDILEADPTGELNRICVSGDRRPTIGRTTSR